MNHNLGTRPTRRRSPAPINHISIFQTLSNQLPPSLCIGRYMLHVTTKTVEELRERIGQSLRMMVSLLEMTTLGKEHRELNNVTVNWVRRIRPVLERNSMLYEQRKFELEERLQDRIVKLNKSVEDMFPR